MNIKQLRKRRGITQEELAEYLSVHVNTIRLWERGISEPRTSDIKKLCEVFNCTEAEFLNGSSEDRWELRVVMRKAGDPQKGVIDMTNLSSNAALYIEDDAMAITLTAGYDLWENDAEFEKLIEQLRRKRATGLKTRREDW